MKLARKIVIASASIFMCAAAQAQETNIVSPEELSQRAENLAALGTAMPAPYSDAKAAIRVPISALAIPEVAASFTPVVVDLETGVAIDGYDPVGYFTENKALRGTPDFTATHNGATYHFVSKENRDTFLSDADRFAPAHGGYCTETLAQGGLTTADPVHWTIHGNRLFLTRSAKSTEYFRENIDRSIASANNNWGQVSVLSLIHI